MIGTLALGFGTYARWPDKPAPALWLDEAWRALSLTSTKGWLSFIDYMKPKSEFLQLSEWVLGKTGLLLFGPEELAFRIWPLLFAILSIVGAFLLIRQLRFQSLAPLAAIMIAFSWAFIYHSREFKPYSMDLALSILSLWAFIRALEKDHYLLYFVLLSLYALSSLTFVFVFPSLFIVHLILKRPKKISDIAIYIIPGLLFVFAYFGFLRIQSIGTTSNFWASHYLTDWNSIKLNFSRFPTYMDGWSVIGWLPVTLLYAVLLPVASIIRKDARGLLFLLPFLFIAVASAFKIYPIFDRPSYFLYGLIHCGAVFGLGLYLDLICSKQPKWVDAIGTGITLIVSGILLFNGTLWGDIKHGKQWPPDTGRYAMTTMAAKVQPGDELFINAAAYYTFKFYQPQLLPDGHPLHDLNISPASLLNDSSTESLCRSMKSTCGHLNPGDTAWFFNSYTPDTHNRFLAVLEPYGEVEIVIGSTFQSLIRFSPTRELDTLICE